MSRHPLPQHARCEDLEPRRLLSTDDGGVTPDVPLMDSAPFDGTEIIANAIARLRQGPSPIPPDNKITPSAVVGGTAATGRQPTGALSGHIVFAAAGHGFTAASAGTWHTQRPALLEMVEDLGNQDQMTFFVNYLFNGGATVVPMRPVGYQPNEVILDNDDPGVTYTGTWSNSTSSIYYGSPGDVPYRFATVTPTETATARFTPNIPVAGFYPVYTWVKDDTDRIDQIYRVAHTGGIAEVHVDHSKVGKGYVYLGTYYFNAGTGGYVEISNQGTNPGGKVVIADHIRFGNGMGNIDRGLGVSGQTRSDEASLYWIEHQRGQGVDDAQFRGTLDTDDNDNVSAPPRWAAWMNREVPGTNNEIFLSYHSNAGGGRGTLGLYNGNNDPNTKTPHQFEWAQLAGKEVNDDLVAVSSQLESPWFNQSNPTLDRSDIEFGEINNLVIGNEFDATIVEVAYHDNSLDAALLRDPKARDYVARASLQATIKYFRTYNSEPTLALPPDAPTNVRSVVQPNGDVTISWAAPVVNAIGGEAPTGYVIYKSTDGYGFGNAITVAGGGTLTYTIPAVQIAAGANFFRVAATNAGGESMPSEVVGNIKGSSGASPILVVQGFDRLDRQLNPRQTTPTSDYDPPFAPGSGNTFDRVRPRFSNSYDYVARAGAAIAAYSGTTGFDTASNEAIIAGQVNLSNYAAVIWLSGEESTADDTFNSTEQTLVTNYLNAGGKLFVSGSEVGFDLDAQGGGASFYNNQLKADYVSDDANTYTAAGAAGSIFANISLTFDNGSPGTYDVNAPDVITTFGGSSVAMNYTSPGSGAAAIVYANAGTGSKVVNMAFPVETITTAPNRNAVMSAVLSYFGISTGVGTGSIAGIVYLDSNGNGVRDGTEPNISGAVVYGDLDNDSTLDANEPSDTTDATGYLINNLTNGSQTLRMQPPASAVVMTQPDASFAYTVNVNGAMTGYNFGRFPIAFTGGSGADACYVRLDSTGTMVEIGFGTTPTIPPTLTIAKTKLTTLSYDGAGGDDTITIDCSNGLPIATFNATGGGDGSSAGDLVRVIGTSASDVISVNGSAITFSNKTINLSGIERIQVDGGAGDDTVNQNAGTTAAITFNGGTSSTSDLFNVAAGAATFNTDGNVGTTNLAIAVASGASALFNTSQHLASLSVTGTATLAAGGSNVIVTRFLSVPGTLDLKDNKLIYDYSGSTPMGTILPRVVSGRNGGSWNGAGIQSTSAGSSGLRGLGIAEASDVVGAAGGTWAGQSVDATALLIKYTYMGDFNLSGAIDADDFFRIDANYGKPTTAYAAGNADYNSIIDGDDFFWIDANFLAQGPPL